MKTPLMQALDYVEELPRLEQPRFVVTCNFETFRVYDRDAWAKSQLIDHPFEFTLAELVDHPEYLSFITDPANSRLEKEKEVSIHDLKDVSPENIHKVIDPLFLDDLKAKFIDIRDSEDLTPRQKKNRYARLHQQMYTLKFFETLRAEWIQNGGTVTLAA